MIITALRLNNNLPGVGYLEKAVDDRVSIQRAFSGIRPLRQDWYNMLRQHKNKNSSSKPGYNPEGFIGWQFSDEEEPKEYVVYHSDHLLAEAFESGRLRPAGSKQTLKTLGLKNSRGQYTPTHLQKHRHLLEALGAFPASALWENPAFITKEEGIQSVHFFQAVTDEADRGIMIACFVPCDVQTESGAVVHSAIWVARACQMTRHGKFIQRPLLLFDGARLQRLPRVDALPEKICKALDHGQILTVDQRLLLPPLTFAATQVVPVEAKGHKSNPPRGNSRGNRMSCAKQCVGLVPAFAAVAVRGAIEKLSVEDSAPLFDIYNYHQLRKQMSGLPVDAQNCDLLLCTRDIPRVENSCSPFNVCLNYSE
ncbi:MAG: hypothetical protein ACOC6C_04625 [Verrucomicrobiota bacterium]